jgi:hypothetical protein
MWAVSTFALRFRDRTLLYAAIGFNTNPLFASSMLATARNLPPPPNSLRALLAIAIAFLGPGQDGKLHRLDQVQEAQGIHAATCDAVHQRHQRPQSSRTTRMQRSTQEEQADRGFGNEVRNVIF